MRTLFNVVVLFALVLFGSVVPASAQDGGGMEDWQIVFSIVGMILIVVVPLLFHFNKVNAEAHKTIGENIKGVAGEVKKVDGKVDEVNRFLRDHFAGKKDK